MRLLTFRRADDPTESESIEETSDEAVDTAAMEDETHATEAPGEVDEKDHTTSRRVSDAASPGRA